MRAWGLHQPVNRSMTSGTASSSSSLPAWRRTLRSLSTFPMRGEIARNLREPRHGMFCTQRLRQLILNAHHGLSLDQGRYGRHSQRVAASAL